MNKVYGNKNDFALVRQDASRTIVSYGYEEVDETYATWYEIYYYKKPTPRPTIENIKSDILEDINSQTDNKILTGFSWEDNNGDTVMVYLSRENQDNYKNAHDMAAEHPEKLPITFKLCDIDYIPHFKVFQTYEELDEFYVAAYDFINAALEEGYQKKYNINWQAYEDALEELFNPTPITEEVNE